MAAKESKMTIVYIYMKNEPRQFESFETYQEAIAFLKAMNKNPECECCGIER
jgi:hypothetical protein